MMENWIIIYRSYTAEKLQEEIDWLQAQSRNLFVAQTEGNRSYQRSSRDLEERLAAATTVMRERTSNPPTRTLQVDLRGMGP